jgi:inosine/xanthosine triphosphate pyrophosphatase family protein
VPKPIHGGALGLNRMLAGFDDHSAYALCVLAYCAGPGHPVLLFEGRTPVRLAHGALCMVASHPPP